MSQLNILSFLFSFVVLLSPSSYARTCQEILKTNSPFENAVYRLETTVNGNRYPEIKKALGEKMWSRSLFLALTQDPGGIGHNTRRLVLDVLANDPVKEMSLMEGDHFDSVVYEVELASGIKGIFKPDPSFWADAEMRTYFGQKSNPTAEIAAYKLAYLLGLNNVPPSVSRTINGMQGGLQLFVESDGFNINELVLDQQASDLEVFEYLIDDIDRHPDNYIESSEAFWGIDFAAGFRDPLRLRLINRDDDGPPPVTPSLAFTQNLEATIPEILIRVLKEHFSIDVIEGVIQRRQRVLDRLEDAPPSYN